MDSLKLKEKASNMMNRFIQIFEILVSVIIAAVIMFMIYNLVASVISANVFSMTTSDFSAFLSSALSLVVGLEFVKLLCQNTPENLIEVLMLAIARQMIVEHLDTLQMLLGIVSIVGLLAAKKYLIGAAAKKDTN